MGHVAEQRGDEQPAGGQAPGSDIEPVRSPGAGQAPESSPQPSSLQPSGPPPQGPQLDAEQLRQFQQFQQFQDFLRYSEAQRHGQGYIPQPPPAELAHAQQATPAPHHSWLPAPPPAGPPALPLAPPRPGLPRWARRLLKRIVRWVLLLAVLALAGTWAYNHFFGSSGDENRPAAETGGGTYRTNLILSTQPYEAVRMVYQHVAQGRADLACGRFDEATQRKFATDLRYVDCAQAVAALHAKVTHVNSYAESIPSSVSGQPPEGTVHISSCQFGVRGGPNLGAFTVTQVEKGQWLITGHAAEPDPCPAPSPSTTASR
jgi:hypothetical protein